MKPSRKLLTCALLLVTGLVLVNYLASSLPVRLDATAEHGSTRSRPGTKVALPRRDPEPLTLDLYCSKDAMPGPVHRVQELRRARAGDAPDSTCAPPTGRNHPPCDRSGATTPRRRRRRATAAGIEAQDPAQAGAETLYYLGMWSRPWPTTAEGAARRWRRSGSSSSEYDLSRRLPRLRQGAAARDKLKKLRADHQPSRCRGPARQPDDGPAGARTASTWWRHGRNTFTSIVPVDPSGDGAAGRLLRRPRRHPSRESPAQAAVRDRPVPPLRASRSSWRSTASSRYFKHLPGRRPDGHDPAGRTAPERRERPARPPRAAGASSYESRSENRGRQRLRARGPGPRTAPPSRYPVFGWAWITHGFQRLSRQPRPSSSTMMFVEAGSVAPEPGLRPPPSPPSSRLPRRRRRA